jgi:Fic family protein
MDDLIRFTNERTLAPIVQAAVVHAQFEAIHPYVDGNGRVGRALIYWVLANRGAIDAIAPPISPVIAESATAYVDGLTTFRRNDPNGWVDIFVGMLNGATGYAAALGTAISDLQASWRQRVSDVRSGAVDHKLVPYLATAPVLDASMIASEFDLTPQAASSALERLEEREIVVFRSLRRGRRGRPAKVYEAAELFDLLDESPRSLIARRT